MAAPRNLQKRTGVVALDRNLDSIQRATDHQERQNDYDKRVLSDVALESAYVNRVAHGLQRVPTGCRVISSDTPVILQLDTSTSDKLYADIVVSTDCTVGLELF